MTFSLAAKDLQSGAFGIVISSSSPAVASRCLHLLPGVGAATSQNVTDPRLGPALLARLASGESADAAVNAVVANEPHAPYRQLTVVDTDGRVAAFTGSGALGVFSTARGEHAVAAGNLLADDRVPQAMLDAYLGSTAATFEERLLDGLRGAMSAGGEAGPVRSAGLAVVESVAWNVTDLRVDDHDHPDDELARVLALWLPQKTAYIDRALRPGDAPSYGVAGDR